MRRLCSTTVTRSFRMATLCWLSVVVFSPVINAALFGTWTPSGDFGPDSPWVCYTLGLSTDDGSNVAALDVSLRGTFHQQWSSFVEGDPFEPTPRGAARSLDSHLSPSASALIVNLNEDSIPNANEPVTSYGANPARIQNGTGTTLSGVWGIPGADQTA